MYCPAAYAGPGDATGGIDCPAGSYCLGGGAQPVGCTGPYGTYCPASCPVNGLPCPAGFECTGGAAAPTACTAPPGYECGAGCGPTYTPCPAGALVWRRVYAAAPRRE